MENENTARILSFPEKRVCAKCHGDVDQDAIFCKHCGSRLEKKEKYVPKTKRTKVPLKTMEEINTMYNYLATPVKNTDHSRRIAKRNSLIFLLGISTGLRASDLVTLKVEHFMKYTGNGTIYVIEKKTRKGREIAVPKNIVGVIKKYISDEHLGYNDYIFRSSMNNYSDGEPYLITTSLNRIIVRAAKALGWDERLYGTHTLRKTYAYQFYQTANSISKENGYRALSILCKELNHSSEAITLAYIGIEQEEICKICDITAERYSEIVNKINEDEDD